MNHLKIITTGFILLGLFCCRREEEQIPNVPVNIYISTADPNFVALNAVGGWVYITGGNRGIVVYRTSQNEFMALERTCSYKPSEANARVEVDVNTNLFLQDLSCGSKFLITDGSVQNSPASYPLRHYNTTFDGVTVHIYN
jgi:nitrite reductase/ring-hydroxylating ferredoxin subunit